MSEHVGGLVDAGNTPAEVPNTTAAATSSTDIRTVALGELLGE